MQSQPELITGAHKKMFAMAMTFFEAASVQSPCQFTRRNAFQDIRILHFNMGDRLAQRCLVEVSFERFDFGQLWHRGYDSNCKAGAPPAQIAGNRSGCPTGK